MRRRKRLSPTVMQGLIWGAAIAACAAFAAVVFVVSGRGRPVLPEPEPIAVGPVVAPRSGEAPGPPDSTGPGVDFPAAADGTPAATLSAAPVPRPSGPRELTEALFVELSAQMLVAADSFTDSEVGQRSFERACEGILAQHGVSRADFEKLEAEIAGDATRQARIVDEVLDRADRLRHPTNVRAGATPGGVVDPYREPPPPPIQPR